MCALAGIIRYQGISVNDEEIVKRMLDLQFHRGPDGTGYKTFSKCVLGQNRLSLIDLTKIQLPIQSRDRHLVLSYNGEIYNYQELKKELELDFEFQTGTDSEVVLAAYQKWGVTCIDKFNGMFAFFIWDNENEVGFAARDPLGIKPFFYCSNDSFFGFASEASTLVQGNLVKFQVSDSYLGEFLTAPYFTGSRSTPFENVEMLLPGHTLRIENGKINTFQYYAYHFRPLETGASADWKTLLEDSVKRTLHSDCEVGLFLSGGLDSTLIASLSQQKLKTWTIRFPENRKEDYLKSLIVKSEDYDFALLASKELGHEFNEVNVSDGLYSQLLIQALERNDLISAWEQEVSQFALAKAASEKVKAVLVGDAADETHFGYPFLLSKEMVSSVENIIRFFGQVPLRPSRSSFKFSDIYKDYSIQNGYSWKNYQDQKLAMSKLIVDFWLRRLLHNGDTHTMAHSLEARVPFADKKLLAATQALTPLDGIEKLHLRDVALTLMDAQLAMRPKSALTKNLRAQKTVHRYFVDYWKKYGDTLSHIVDSDCITQWTLRPSDSLSDYDLGLEFRMLAALVWRSRFI